MLSTAIVCCIQLLYVVYSYFMLYTAIVCFEIDVSGYGEQNSQHLV